uniref:WGS project CBMI000000000 data, contig CS3069_c004065 n=1 Tax=Fusarium clavum TaxID=2594811 RepID=A0A090MED3_9HYPO|nr:unnamed protein product [Fusarium clavum]
MELAALTLRSTDLALELFLDCLQPNATRFMSADSKLVHHLLRNLSAIALDHIEEAGNVAKPLPDLHKMKLYPKSKDGTVVEIDFRIDTTGTPKKSSHVRLTSASLPSNVLVGTKYSIDALVEFSETGRARFKCLHPLPSYFADCSWVLEDCGPFVTSKSMIDAVRDLNVYQEQCCGVADMILGLQSMSPILPTSTHAPKNIYNLNESQNKAIQLSLASPLLYLWGPPGTGKTATIVEMICALQIADESVRILVTAPTHNAVDNVIRRYIARLEKQPLGRESEPNVVRVSTEVRKVADDLRRYTCDAMAGQEIYSNRKALEKATQMIRNSDTVFTTCIGAGIGLLRSEQFDTVIVDEASQQTEPTSLVPFVKGCSRAILVGDHVQLRPTVNSTALALDFDVSLFERLYTNAKLAKGDQGVSTLMLDTQYRMHPKLCEFPSQEFYDGNLKSGIRAGGQDTRAHDNVRAIFINCDSTEMPGQKSKENRGQAELCAQICKLLTTSTIKKATSHSIVVLTPYTRQAEYLKRMLPSISQKIEVSSIDGFQGREADIIIFVTVRCNAHREIGFLKDMRRVNVALTRARSALIVIGNRATLAGGTADEESSKMWKRLLGALTEVKLEVPDSA